MFNRIAVLTKAKYNKKIFARPASYQVRFILVRKNVYSYFFVLLYNSLTYQLTELYQKEYYNDNCTGVFVWRFLYKIERI